MQAKSPGNRFVLNDYYSYPEKYESVFESYLPYLTVLVNGIYWEPKYPRLVTKAGLRKLFQTEGKPRLRVIGDITCDIEGSIECTLKATNSANPIYVYDPFKETIQDGWQGNGLVVLAVDKLPSELPREASEAFGDALLPFVPQLAAVDFLRPFDQLELPDAFRNALIAHNGQLTPEYKYLKKFIKV